MPDDSASKSKIHSSAPRAGSPCASCAGRMPKHVQTQRIPVTLAERPYPFPSRTRKLSSPAPKILRGQPFGKIGRRQDFCVSGEHVRVRARAPRPGGPACRPVSCRDDRSVDRGAQPPAPSGPTVRTPASTAHLSLPARRRRRLAQRRRRRASIAARRSAPPAPLAAEKQRRLCLTADHAACRDVRRRARPRRVRPVDDRAGDASPRPIAADDAGRPRPRPARRSPCPILPPAIGRPARPRSSR